MDLIVFFRSVSRRTPNAPRRPSVDMIVDRRISQQIEELRIELAIAQTSQKHTESESDVLAEQFRMRDARFR